MTINFQERLKNMRSDRRLNFGFVLAMVGLVAVGVFLYRGIQEIATVSEERAQARQAAYQIKTLINLLTDAETGQRGFLLTGRDSYLIPYKNAAQRIPKVSRELDLLLARQPDQIERLQRMGFLVDEKMTELAAAVRARREHGLVAAMKIVDTDHGQDFMEELRDLSREMDNVQKLQIGMRNERMNSIIGRSYSVVFFGSGMAVFVVALCLFFLDRNQRRRVLTERSLVLSNEALEKQHRLLSKVITAQNKIGTASLNSNTILELVAQYSMEITGADGATIELLEGHTLVCRYTSGTAQMFNGVTIDRYNSLSGACLTSGEGIVSNDADSDPRVDREKARSGKIASIAVVPLQHGSRTIGVLKNISMNKDHFDGPSFNALTLVTGVLASALGQASEFEEKLAAVIDLEKAKIELIDSRDKARAATEAKSRFLANMSHELRTPLNGVLGMTQLLMDGRLSEQQSEYASAIRSSGQSLLRLVSDILDSSKIEAGRLEFENVDFDISSTMQDVVKSFSPIVRQKNLTLSLESLTPIPPYVKGDPGRIRQILVNLINNAIKFTAQGAVRVSVETLPSEKGDVYLRFKVQDSGIGIPADSLKTLFEEFTQADASTTRRYGGTGLGLSICKKLCEMMNGDIGVDTREGHGSVFWFTIRLELGQSVIKIESDDPIDWQIPANERPWRALVAEDNQFNQIIIVKMLEKLGVHADIAGNGKEAVDALQSRPYDVILMDCQMPEMDGFEATEFIRTSGLVLHSKIPIIAMTANAMKGDQETCLKAGMDDYVSKPLDIKQVRELMLKWLPVPVESKVA